MDNTEDPICAETKEEHRPITKQEVLEQLIMMIQKYDDLPPYAMYASCTQADFYALLLILVGLLRAED